MRPNISFAALGRSGGGCLGGKCPDQIEDDNVCADEITDEALEAAASGPVVTFTLSVVLFACQFC
jgi:hypothetical protein